MKAPQQKLSACLWFDDQALEAAEYYVSIFKNARLERITRYGKEGFEIHGHAEGTVMVAEFEIEGQTFTALNGGPQFKFNESISFQVHCSAQAELDYYWDRLSQDGDEQAQQCGWLKDKYGVSWQVVPDDIADLVGDPNSEQSQRAMRALLRMKKIDIETLRQAYEGRTPV